MPHPKAIPAVFVALVSLAALAACNKAEAPAAPSAPGGMPGVKGATATDIAPLAQKKFGAAITESTSTPIERLMNDPGKFADKTVRTEGLVSAVCQAAGCWMEIGAEAGQAHIKMAGHSFTVPRSASGHKAVVQGRVIKPAGGEDDCSREAKEATGKVAQVQIEATGVEFVD